MKRNIVVGLVFACLALASGIYVYQRFFAPGEEAGSVVRPPAQQVFYTCPMHPSVWQNGSGACPVCGMRLVKRTQGVEDDSGRKSARGEVSISPGKELLANVATAEAGTEALNYEIHAVGRIDYAEPNRRKISMRFPARIERLYLTYTGQRVSTGDPVADVYSPEAISAQQEYLLAKEGYDSVMNEAEVISGGARELLDQSREKLLRWGFTATQISFLDDSHKPLTTMTIYSPIAGTVVRKNIEPQDYAAAGEAIFEVADLSTVWLYVDVYEQDIRSVSAGQRVEASSDALRGKTFGGNVTFISPTIDPASRTVRVRADVPNAGGQLKIDMYVDVTIHSALAATVVVPASAVISFGSRQIVWVRKRAGVFEPRTVIVGVTSGGKTQVLRGLVTGERVAVSGGYLLDSESRMQDGGGGSHD